MTRASAEPSTRSESFDVLVIGSGPGGYVAAIRAAQLGLRTGIVERATLGGICLNWGCIPTKALLHGAEVAHTIAEAGTVGFTVGNVALDLGTLVKHSRDTAARLSRGVAYLMRTNGVEVVHGSATVTDKGRVRVSPTAEDGSGEPTGEPPRDLRATHIILATGARPRSLPGIEPDGDRIWTYFDALVPSKLPQSLLVVGSGAIGSEFTSLYTDLGTRVTLVELADRILPVEDAEVSAAVRASFERRGIGVHTRSTLGDVRADGNGVTATLRGPDGTQTPVAADRLLLSAGIRANTEGIGLEGLGVELDHGYVKVDEWGRTNVAGLYAIGDVAGPPCLAHKASHEGVITVEHLAGVPGVRPLDRARVPGATYTRPEVASVGLTEAAARELGRPIRIGRSSLSSNGRAIGAQATDGFTKTIFDASTGELLGAHFVGASATEQLQGAVIAQHLEATDADLAEVVFPHPTLSEAFHESVLDALGRPLNQ